MNTARLLRLQPLRAAAFRQPALRQSTLRQTRLFHNTRPMLRTKEDDQSAHTITQRLRNLKRIPPELLPLGVVILFALFAACFAMGKKLMTDKTLRLSKSPPKSAH
ncbi:uncharacterized protein Z518_07591 [Rhinocladiella mackenziei CBS 650.93]|uniref:Rhinocladiella mackenziei CBS 650.93 unplaced genomic scaffold supercont1.5, whole genome shotgun sequence n=1 Tax=Rhinocladiella mackenziei CBS 650.93 TaxID=1442369 RepID=A0A0D2H0U0_9EURO|nr:uncharacterized protein Z518_07591 [Rhinocladiella mackenziei CBS 650.93]KIX04038.1 hypothetical protein Z518_07591 [Rhinocladiella mackenziei CBS 650.93]